MKVILTSMAMVLLASLPALAQSEKLDCDSEDLDQTSLNICAEREYRAIDAKLNELYRTMMSKYDARNRALLQASERAWLTYRDAECAFETAPTIDGSIHSLVQYGCLSKSTTARIKELNEQLNCEEGNMSCNAPG